MAQHSRFRPITGSRALARALASTALSPVWILPVTVALGLGATPAAAQELPSGGSVAAGAAAIATPAPGQMQIDQTSQRAVINWQGFSVGQGAAVQFNQPGRNAAVLNRVTGDVGSRIDGSIAANGHVYVVNPRGVIVGPTGRVDAQGFVASSLQIDDEDFMQGRLTFSGGGDSANVENHGAITVGHGGYAALLGGKVVNTGTIVAPMGRVGFGSGERAVIDLSGDRFLQIAMPTERDEEVLIDQAGRISADGGLVEMRAATAREAARRVVNMSGVTEARSVSGRNGRIVLGGGSGGTVRVTGQVRTAPAPSARLVDVSPRPAARPDVEITGREIELAGAVIDARGIGGGGSIRIGGDFAGLGSLPRADMVSADAATRIDVSAIGTGAGGEAAIWSDAATVFLGSVDARGAAGGTGGFVEVSSARTLTFDGRVQVGPGGTLWLDPENFEICAAGECGGLGSQVTPGSLTTVIDGGGLAVVDTASGDVPGNSGRITVTSTVVSSGTGELRLLAQEDILLQAPITLPNGTLTLSAAEQIFPGVGITPGDIDVDVFALTGGTWIQSQIAPASFSANDFRLGAGASFLRAPGQGTVADPFEINDVHALQGMASAGSVPTIPGNPTLSDAVWRLGQNIDASGTANWNDTGSGAEGFVPIGAFTPFGGTLDGSGGLAGNRFTIDGLFSSASSDVGLFGQTDDAFINDLALTNIGIEIDTGGATAGGLVGFATGTTISDVSVGGSLTIPAGTAIDADLSIGGLVGTMDGGSITDSVFTGAISAPDTTLVPDFDLDFPTPFVGIGGMVGRMSGGTLTNVATDGSIGVSFDLDTSGGTPGAGADGALYAGGVVGQTVGSSISSATSSTPVTVAHDRPAGIGGLIGLHSGEAVDSEVLADATVSVTQGRAGTIPQMAIGGAIGAVFAFGEDSEIVSNVTARNDVVVDGEKFLNVGGFVGQNGNDIEASRSFGDVTVTTSQPDALGPIFATNVGGFAGLNAGSGEITTSRAEGDVTLTQQTFFEAGLNRVGGFTGSTEGAASVSQTAATGAVSASADTGSATIGGHTGFNDGPISDSYALGGASASGAATSAVGGLVGEDGFSINRSFASGSVSAPGGSATGGLVGDSVGSPSVIASFWDVTTTGQATSNGGTGLTTAELQDTAGFIDAATWDFASVWAPGAPGIYPQLYTIDPVVYATPDPVSVPYGDPAGPFTGTFAGGPPAYLFGDPADTLDEPTVFAGLAVPGTDAGLYAFGGTATADAGVTDFTVIYAPEPFEVTPLPLEITALDQSKVYGTDPFALDETEGSGWEITSGTLVAGDSVDAVDLESFGEPVTAEVGLYDIVIENVSGQGLLNYEISLIDALTDGDNGLTVELRPLELTAFDQIYVYGDPFTLDETQGTGWDVTGGTSLVPGDAIGAVDLVSAREGPGALAGSDPILFEGIDGTRLSNYDITTVPGTLTVTQRPLEITAFDQTREAGDDSFVLDESRPAAWDITSGTLVGNDVVDAVDLTSDGAAPGAPGGTYSIDNDGVTGVGLANYAIAFVPGTLTVESVTLTIVATNQSKTYRQEGFSLDGSAFTVSGLEPGDSVDSVSLSSPGAAIGADAGVYTITITSASGSGLGGYEITFGDGQLTVTPAPLTVTAADQTSGVAPEGVDLGNSAFSVQGLRGSDTVDNVQLSSVGAAAGALPGAYEIVPSNADGTGLIGSNGLANYTITYVPGTLTINGFPLTIIAGDQTRAYNDLDFVLDPTAFVVEGLREGDSVDTVVLTSEGMEIGAPVADDYAIVPSDAAGEGIENYLITYQDGILSVTPGELLIMPTAQDKTYGDPAFVLDPGAVMATGLVTGDTLDAVTLTSAGVPVGAPVGTYAIDATDPVGSGLENYVVRSVPGTLAVTPAPLVVTPLDQSKPEGARFTFDGTEFTTEGLRNADAVTSATLTSEAAGRGGTQAGSPFPIFASDAQGTGLANYDLSFGIGTFTVTEREGPDPDDRPDVIFPPQGPGLVNFTDPSTVLVGLREPSSAATIGGGSGADGGAGGGGGGSAQSLQIAETALVFVERASSELTARAAACREEEGQVTEFLGCISEALAAYSASLDPAQIDLAPELSGVSSALIVARDRIDAARARATQRLANETDPAARRAIEQEAVAEARGALADAAAEISAAITLIRADDPGLEATFRAQGDAVLTAISSVDLELQRAVGL